MYNDIQPQKSFKERSFIQHVEQRSLPVNDQILNVPQNKRDTAIISKSANDRLILKRRKRIASPPLGQTITNSLNLKIN